MLPQPDYDLTLYANVESLVLAYFPFPQVTPETNTAFQDVNIRGIEDYVDGPYRQVDAVYLHWMELAIESVKKRGKNTSAMEDFFGDCLRNSGLKPSTLPISPRYTKPCGGRFLQFDGSFDLWDNIETDAKPVGHRPVSWGFWTAEDHETVKWFLEASKPGSQVRTNLISNLQGRQIARWEKVIDAEKTIDDMRTSAMAGVKSARNCYGAFCQDLRRIKSWIDGGCVEAGTV